MKTSMRENENVIGRGNIGNQPIKSDKKRAPKVNRNKNVPNKGSNLAPAYSDMNAIGPSVKKTNELLNKKKSFVSGFKPKFPSAR